MGANDTQIDGSHYKDLPGECPECGAKIDHWDWAADMPYLEGRCTAYIARHRHKKGVIDVEKGLHFIQKILEKRYGLRLVWRIEDLKDASQEDPELEPGKLFKRHSRQNPYAHINPD